MANKTIHDLSPASTVSGSYEFAIYDIDNNTTKKATANQIFTASDLLYADDDEPTGSAIIKTIKNRLTNNTIYPITKVGAVYMSDDTTTAQEHITALETKVGTATLNTTAQNLCGAINQHESDINTLNSNLSALQIQRGRENFTASGNTQTEVTISLPTSYSSGEAYAVVVSLVVYSSANIFSYIVRSKTASSFVVRVYNSSPTNTDAYIDWVTVKL